jgi:hypothetical protein
MNNGTGPQRNQRRDDSVSTNSNFTIHSEMKKNEANADELFLDDDLCGMFDDENDDDLSFGSDTLGFVEAQEQHTMNQQQQDSNSASTPNTAQKQQQQESAQRAATNEVHNSSVAADDNGVKAMARRRTSALENGKNQQIPPLTWHSEAADKHHRQAMIVEMYVYARVFHAIPMRFSNEEDGGPCFVKETRYLNFL